MTAPDEEMLDELAKPIIERTGNCWEASFNKLIEMAADPEVRLVHGLPTGISGEAAKAGVYPHAWIEKGGMCWDCSVDSWLHRGVYYLVGNITYSVSYTRLEALRAIEKHETFGPWAPAIIARDAEIDRMFG